MHLYNFSFEFFARKSHGAAGLDMRKERKSFDDKSLRVWAIWAMWVFPLVYWITFHFLYFSGKLIAGLDIEVRNTQFIIETCICYHTNKYLKPASCDLLCRSR